MFKLMKFLSPYKGRAAAMLILLFLQVLGTLYIPTLTADIVNNGIVAGDLGRIWQTGAFMLAVAVAIAVVSIAETYLSTAIFSALGRDIRNALFEKSQALTINEFNRFGPASMLTRCTNDITQIQQAYMAATEMLLPAPVMAIAGLILAYSKSPTLAMVIVGAMVIVCAFTALIGARALPLFSRLQTLLDKINRVLRENLTGVRVIRAFNRAGFEQQRADASFGEYAQSAIRVNKIFAVLMPVILLVLNLSTVVIVAVGGQRVSDGAMQIGDIMALIEYAVLILMYLIMGVMIFMIFPRAQSCAKRVNAVLSVPENGAEAPRTTPGRQHKYTAKLEFRNVTFQYQGAEEPVLNNISFTADVGKTTAIIGGTGSGKSTIASLIPRFYDIQSGTIRIDGRNIVHIPKPELRARIGFVPQKAFLFSGTILDNFRHGKKDATMEEIRKAAQTAQIAGFIVGPTGAGKTTLVNLLMRFYELQGGRITIDGVDIASMTRGHLRSLMGMVLQDTWLFGGTIRDNIAYGKADATDEQIFAAAKAARADHFIRTMPLGYDTVLSDEIASLSQGQRQLLTIARAILADPAILILDEATSSVDTRTELEIQKAMDALMQGRTSFVIAHRLSTIRDANCILVMKDGAIIEQGSHEELMKLGKFYADLYNSQFAAKAA